MEEIIIVDDDKNLAFTLNIYLSNSGYSSNFFENAKDVISYIKDNHDISLFITDVNMSEINGFELIKHIRSYDKYAETPILMLTGSTESSIKYQSFNDGADDFLTKPFDPIELLLRIKSLLKRNNNHSSISTTNYKNEIEIENPSFSSSHAFEINSNKIVFTPKEFDIFHYLFINDNKLVTNEELLTKVFDYPHGTGNPEIIRTHIKNIRLKIEKDHYNPSILKNIPRKGYFLVKDNVKLISLI